MGRDDPETPDMPSMPSERTSRFSPDDVRRVWEEDLSWQPFPISVFPSSISEYAVQAADAQNSVPAVLATLIIPVLSACIGNSYRLRIKRSWEERACLWTAVVLGSGSGKSPAINKALIPVFDIENKIGQRYDQEMERYEEELSMSKNGDAPPTKPERRQLRMDNTTLPSVLSVHDKNPRGLILAKDELSSWLASFDAYTSASNMERGQWLELYGGSQIVVNRKTDDVPVRFINNPNVSITGAIQPEVLASMLTPEDFVAGLPARFNFVEPPVGPNVWTDADVSREVLSYYCKTVKNLYGMPYYEDSPYKVDMSPEAKQLFIEFYSMNNLAIPEMEYEPLKAVYSKATGTCPRIALMLHLCDFAETAQTGVAGDIDGQTMEKAIRLTKWLRREQVRLYQKYRFITPTEGKYAMLDEVGEEFSTSDAIDASDGVSDRTVKRWLKLLEKDGYLDKVGHGAYKKVPLNRGSGSTSE